MENSINEILSGQRGLAGVQNLLVGRSMRRLLHQELQAMMAQPAELQNCTLRRAKYKPGRKLTAYFDLQLRQPLATDPTMRSIAVTWALPKSRPEVGSEYDWSTAETEIMERGLAAPFQQLVKAIGNGEIHIQIAPLDPRYPQLARLSEPDYVRNLLSANGASGNSQTSQRGQAYTVTPIRYRPRQRHVLRYDPANAASPNGPGTIFAKLYREGKQPPIFALTHQLADWLAASTSGVDILRPQAYIPAEKTLLYPWMAGVPLSQLLGTSNPALPHYLEQTGAALRILHNAPSAYAQEIKSKEIGKEAKAITRACEHIQALLPEVGTTIQGLLQRAQERYETLPQESPIFIHADFKADHVMITPDPTGARLTLFDFDSCALGDPAFDIGKFLADLEWWYATHGCAGVTQARNEFLAGYNLDPAHPRLQRAQVWEALVGIKIVAHRVWLFDPDWASRTTLMIDRISSFMEKDND